MITNGKTIDIQNHCLLFYSYTVHMHVCITVSSVTRSPPYVQVGTHTCLGFPTLLDRQRGGLILCNNFVSTHK